MKIDHVSTTRTNWYNLNDTEEFLNRPAGFYFTLDNNMSYGPFCNAIHAKIAYVEYMEDVEKYVF